MKKGMLIFIAMFTFFVSNCDSPQPVNVVDVVTNESDPLITEEKQKNSEDLPRRMQFSKDGRRLVTGPGEPKDLYDFSHIRRIELQFQQSDWADQLAAIYGTDEELPARMIYDGNALPANVGISFKGSSSYNENPTPKKSFNVSIDYEDEKQRINGFDSLNLHCGFEDNSFMREVIYEHVNQSYMPAFDVNYVELYINDQPWGLYINMQQFDNDFIKEWFLSKKGTRWRAEPVGPNAQGYGRGKSSLNYLGESPSDYEPYYNLKKTYLDDPWTGLIDACRTLNQTPLDQLEKEICNVMDLDRTIWFLVMENVFGDNDSYTIKGGTDYCLYFEPTTAWLTPIQYDANGMFGYAFNVRFGPFQAAYDASLPLLNKLLAVPNIRERYLAHMRTVLNEAFNPQYMNAMIDEYAAKIDAYMRNDPKSTVTYNDFLSAVNKLKTDIQTRYTILTTNQYVAAEGLRIADVKWTTRSTSPWVSPTAADSVTISATVTGTTDIGSVNAYVGTGIYGAFSKTEMYDDGAHNDGKANDGVFGTTVPPHESGTRIRFYIEAICDNAAGTTTYFPAKAEHDVFTWVVD